MDVHPRDGGINCNYRAHLLLSADVAIAIPNGSVPGSFLQLPVSLSGNANHLLDDLGWMDLLCKISLGEYDVPHG